MDTDSVVGDTLIYVNGKKIKISDYYDSTRNQYIRKDDFNKNFVKIANEGDTSLSINEQGIVEEKPISYVMKHTVKKQMFKITDNNGNSVIVTEDHSIIVKDKKTSKIKSIAPKELNSKKHYIISIISIDTNSHGG